MRRVFEDVFCFQAVVPSCLTAWLATAAWAAAAAAMAAAENGIVGGGGGGTVGGGPPGWWRIDEAMLNWGAASRAGGGRGRPGNAPGAGLVGRGDGVDVDSWRLDGAWGGVGVCCCCCWLPLGMTRKSVC